MAHKTITISEEAYNALAARKEEHESFTDVILRVTSDRGKASSLLKLVESWLPDEDLARNIESTIKKLGKRKYVESRCELPTNKFLGFSLPLSETCLSV